MSRYEDCGVNRMTVRRFRDILAAAGLECVFFKTNLSDRPAMVAMRGLRRLPGLSEYFTHNVYSIWKHPA